MSWYDEDPWREWKSLLDKADKIERLVLLFCQKHYPRYMPVKAIDQGDVVIYYLRCYDETKGVNNFGMEDLVVYYNTWYPGEFNVSRLTMERKSRNG